jgi:hypothetical protein
MKPALPRYLCRVYANKSVSRFEKYEGFVAGSPDSICDTNQDSARYVLQRHMDKELENTTPAPFDVRVCHIVVWRGWTRCVTERNEVMAVYASHRFSLIELQNPSKYTLTTELHSHRITAFCVSQPALRSEPQNGSG